MTIVSTTSQPTASPASSPLAPPTGADDRRGLRLLSVLASGLPADLGTITEPAAYTVPAVFSRQVTHEERLRIEDPAVARRLVERTGADASLALVVEDRRLLIQNTTLRRLEDGLAAAIGEMLLELDQDLLAAQDRRAAEAGARQAVERTRSDRVIQAAARISFDPSSAAGSDDGSTGSR
ncbi:MAG: hypothetical protein KJ792_13100 [Actinobacteria bacterium]|nr:hypothetical protein [Actinomycetota bacterium]MCG2800467.1 hypothetical protein [Cellulomonas sp.]